jgi:hypothetical protein
VFLRVFVGFAPFLKWAKNPEDYARYGETRMNALVFEETPINTRFIRLFCLKNGVLLGSLRI